MLTALGTTGINENVQITTEIQKTIKFIIRPRKYKFTAN